MLPGLASVPRRPGLSSPGKGLEHILTSVPCPGKDRVHGKGTGLNPQEWDFHHFNSSSSAREGKTVNSPRRFMLVESLEDRCRTHLPPSLTWARVGPWGHRQGCDPQGMGSALRTIKPSPSEIPALGDSFGEGARPHLTPPPCLLQGWGLITSPPSPRIPGPGNLMGGWG
jgi:hypothetical protein